MINCRSRIYNSLKTKTETYNNSWMYHDRNRHQREVLQYKMYIITAAFSRYKNFCSVD